MPLVVADIVDEPYHVRDCQVNICGHDGQHDEVGDLIELLELRMERNVEAEDRGPVEQLDARIREDPVVERDTERLPEDKEAKQERTEPAPGGCNDGATQGLG